VIRFLITYDTPNDPESFDKHYREIHSPLTRALPGISSYTIHKHPQAVRGKPYHQIVEITWPDWDAARGAFASPEGLAAAEDMANLDAPARSCVYETRSDVDPTER
jgi:uncharacterized protein (TIGR02118 family)